MEWLFAQVLGTACSRFGRDPILTLCKLDSIVVTLYPIFHPFNLLTSTSTRHFTSPFFCCSHLSHPFLSSDPDFPKNIPTLSPPRRFYLPYSLSLLFASLLISNIPSHFLFPIALQPLSGSKPDKPSFVLYSFTFRSLPPLPLPLHRRSSYSSLSLSLLPLFSLD